MELHGEDGIEKAIGRFGIYQAWILFLITLARLPGEFQLSNVVFLLPKADYTCLDDGVNNATNYCPCQNPEFDTSTIVTSITSDFQLICNKKSWASLSQSMLQVGVGAGSLIYGFISDRYGRRVAVLLALFCNALFGALSSLSTQLWMFIMCRFLSGFALGGTMLCCFVMMIELSGKSFRPYMMGLAEIAYVCGYIILPIIAYFVREWKQLQLVTCAPWFIVVVYYWLIPESPRWLITVGKKKEAVVVLTNIAKRNNRPVENIEAIVDQIEAESIPKDPQQRTGSYADLFKTPKIRMYSILTPLVWTSCTLIYTGINQYIGRLQGNIYLNVLLSAAALTPAPVLIVIASLYLKRKISVITCFAITGSALLVFLIIPKNMESTILAFAIIGQIGGFGAFVLTYLFTSEIFPTIIRNSAMGMCSTFGRIGGFIAPFVVNIGIEWVSILIFSSVAICAAALCWMLPETNDIILLNSIEQTEIAHSTKGKKTNKKTTSNELPLDCKLPTSLN
ncbi:organic cation transporter-like protein [Ostrinia nubilalis]|uniref:organic cation transporter-like protein n=1 Tax=Ostrinia nubilalis TaxID=29057 RepID=UPI00308267CE